MDKIIFIEDGQVVAIGSHEELYNTCKPYHDMVELQKLDDEDSTRRERRSKYHA